MKKMFIFQLLMIAVLVVAFVTALVPKAHATGETKYVVGTVCCNGTAYTGNANDCVSGAGACVNHNCATGETETAGGSCAN